MHRGQFNYKIDFVEVVHYFNFKQVFHLLSKLYDKSGTPAEPLPFLNMRDIGMLNVVVVVVDPTPPTCCQQEC